MSAPRPPVLGLSRFERRILTALVAVAIVPLFAALLFGRAALRDAFSVGVNEQVEAQLDQGLELYRAYFVALRSDADRAADAIAFDHRFVSAARRDDLAAVERRIEATLAREDATDEAERTVRVARIELRRDGELLARGERPVDLELERTLILTRSFDAEDQGVGVLAHRTTSEAPALEPVDEGERAGELEAPRFDVEIVLATRIAPFEEHARAGEVAEVYRRLRGSSTYLSESFLVAYSSLLVAVIAIALAVGLFVSRRLTRRVAVLADAARRVGAGDLTVEVPSDRGDEVGELVRAFNAMVRDIRSSRDRIEYLQRMAAWQEMARRLAHEIKNPLTPIQLAVQDLHERYGGDDARFKRRLDDARDIVEEEVRTLRRLVGEFSDFARLPVPELASHDLAAFARDVVRTFEPAAMLPSGALHGAPRLVTELSETPVPVQIDPGLLRKVVDNLVRNAVHALVLSSGARDPGTILVAVRVELGRALLEVRDDGPGVPEAERERVFDAYFTTKAEGTGLGLAITKKVVLEHGGAIECRAAPEGGAAFRVLLPLDGRSSEDSLSLA